MTDKKLTVNSLLCYQKALKMRKGELENVRSSTTQCTRRIDVANNETIEELLYDIKKVDKKIIQLNKALFKIDDEIKRSNTSTTVELQIDFDDLMSEISE
ncbi:MAG TPA: hypothetical protein VI911_10530 [Patescibacteria group bacterium]|nr:hypothetical protein [Patescibacteria group bacterium]